MGYDVNEVKEEFTRLSHEDKIQSVMLLRNKPTSYYNYFIIKLKPNIDAKIFRNIDLFLNHKVVFEIFKSSETVQCYRYQRIDHVAYNCNLDPRCVKCLNSHAKDQCPVDNIGQKVACVYNQEGHVASFRGCPVHMKINQKRLKIIQNKPDNIKLIISLNLIFHMLRKQKIQFQ